MKFGFAASLLSVLLLSGCLFRKSAPGASPEEVAKQMAQPIASPAAGDAHLIITPDSLVVGQVVSFNIAGRFAVLNFPRGIMPAAQQVMFIYRQGLKVGEVRVTGPERDYNTVGDLISGEAQKGDEVRDK